MVVCEYMTMFSKIKFEMTVECSDVIIDIIVFGVMAYGGQVWCVMFRCWMGQVRFDG